MDKHDLPGKINTFLNCVIGAFTGVFVAESLYTYWDYKTHPEIYAVTSAPWYTSILMFGIITLATILVALVIKLIIRKKIRKNEKENIENT